MKRKTVDGLKKKSTGNLQDHEHHDHEDEKEHHENEQENHEQEHVSEEKKE